MRNLEDSHRTLRLLEEISKGDALTQRDLSDRVGVALGLVNSYLKNLVARGHVKISAIPKKRYRYYVTPKGFVEKSRLTYHMLANYTRIFTEARRDYTALFRKLHASGVKGVLFAGTDEVAEIAYLSLQETGMEFLGALDSDKAGEEFFRTRIMGFGELDRFTRPVVVITTYNKKDAVYRRLQESSVSDERVHCIYPLAERVRGRRDD